MPVFFGTAGDDSVAGSNGYDTIYGFGRNDTLFGGSGDDRLLLGRGSDTAFGGTGDDSIIAEGGGDDLVFGGAGNDTILGQAPGDYRGGDGDDLIWLALGTGSPTPFTADGGAGTDRILLDLGGSTGWTVDGLLGTAIAGTATAATFRRMESLHVRVEGGGHSLAGGDGADIFEIAGNFERITTLAIIAGRGGDDTFIVHGQDRYTIDGGEGNDRLVIRGWAPDKTRTLALDADGTISVRGGMGIGSGIEALEASGSGGSDSLFGGIGDDILRGEGGDDLIRGNAGDDVLQGDGDSQISFGNDRLFGGDGNDRLAGGNGADRLYGGDGDDILFGYGFFNFERANAGDRPDRLFGGSGNDTLIGSLARDLLFGGAGDDTLADGEGQDRMHGGAGRDVFQWAGSPVGAEDVILDFEAGTDRIDLRHLDADPAQAGDQAFSLVDAFSGTAGEAKLREAANRTWLALDTDGDGITDLRLDIRGDRPDPGDILL